MAESKVASIVLYHVFDVHRSVYYAKMKSPIDPTQPNLLRR